MKLRSRAKRIAHRFTGSALTRMHASRRISNSFSIWAENAYAALRGLQVRFRLDEGGEMIIEDHGRRLVTSGMPSDFSYFRAGIAAREEFIFRSYCLHHVDFRPGDVVLDCGANRGDLFLRLERLIDATDYYGFEPSPSDYRALRRNTGAETKLFMSALGDVEGELPFFISTRGQNSSLVEPPFYTEVITVPVLRLDSFLILNSISSVKLLKVEAEGFEPEILRGLGDKLGDCEYIALDGGYERGPECEQTLTTCTNFLLSRNFEMLDFFQPWMRALFRRKVPA